MQGCTLAHDARRLAGGGGNGGAPSPSQACSLPRSPACPEPQSCGVRGPPHGHGMPVGGGAALSWGGRGRVAWPLSPLFTPCVSCTEGAARCFGGLSAAKHDETCSHADARAALR